MQSIYSALKSTLGNIRLQQGTYSLSSNVSDIESNTQLVPQGLFFHFRFFLDHQSKQDSDPIHHGLKTGQRASPTKASANSHDVLENMLYENYVIDRYIDTLMGFSVLSSASLDQTPRSSSESAKLQYRHILLHLCMLACQEH